MTTIKCRKCGKVYAPYVGTIFEKTKHYLQETGLHLD